MEMSAGASPRVKGFQLMDRAGAANLNTRRSIASTSKHHRPCQPRGRPMLILGTYARKCAALLDQHLEGITYLMLSLRAGSHWTFVPPRAADGGLDRGSNWRTERQSPRPKRARCCSSRNPINLSRCCQVGLPIPSFGAIGSAGARMTAIREAYADLGEAVLGSYLCCSRSSKT